MGFQFTFRQLDSSSDLRRLIDFLASQPLNYPHYEDWLQRTEFDLDSGYKTSVLALSHEHLVGDLVYQPHKQLPRVRELKNVRVHPEFQRRYFALFMLKQAEIEGLDTFDAIVADARTDNPPSMNMLRLAGYTPLMRANLYDPSCPDLVMVKCFNATTENGILHRTRQHISRTSL